MALPKRTLCWVEGPPHDRICTPVEPMNDRGTLIEMLERAHIVWEPDPDSSDVKVGQDYYGRSDQPNNDGYAGFFTVFEFDDTGALKKMGAWE